MLIDNEWFDARGGVTFECVNPYGLRPWLSVPRAGATDVDAALSAARTAFEGHWSKALPVQRAGCLRASALGEGNAATLSEVQVRENGKLLREVQGQARLKAAHLHYYAGLAETLHGDTPRDERPGHVDLLGAGAYRRRGGDHPVELAAVVAAVEARAGNCRRATRLIPIEGVVVA